MNNLEHDALVLVRAYIGETGCFRCGKKATHLGWGGGAGGGGEKPMFVCTDHQNCFVYHNPRIDLTALSPEQARNQIHVYHRRILPMPTPDDHTELKMTIEGALQRYIERGGDDIAKVYDLVDAAWIDAVDAVCEELKTQPAMRRRLVKGDI